MKNANKKAVAITLVLAFTLVMVFSVAFIAVNHNHICIGDSCPVCLGMCTCAHSLSALKEAAVLFVALFFAVAYTFINSEKNHTVAFFPTLVSQKVKQSN